MITFARDAKHVDSNPQPLMCEASILSLYYGGLQFSLFNVDSPGDASATAYIIEHWESVHEY